MSKLPSGIREYLRGRFAQGDIVLFTGAGFSTGVQNQAGSAVPSVNSLRGLLSELVYPRTTPDPNDSLADLFGLARSRAYNRLKDLLSTQFCVDRANLPRHFSEIFGYSWHRVYTLNIDDLPDAVGAASTLPRPIASISPTKLTGHPDSNALQVIHLNGRWDDGPDGVTFSPFDYGSRYPGADPLHAQCAVDILSRPVVFIGTRLDEPPLWEHVQLRRSATGRDLRRRSFLVTPELTRSRRDLLERELHVEHVPMTFEEFHEEVLRPASSGSETFFRTRRQHGLWDAALVKPPLVAELAAQADKLSLSGEYLLGREPTWLDILEKRAAVRDFESELLETTRSYLSLTAKPKPPVIVVGTAGSGKSTSCMRLALVLSGDGINCGWTDADINVSPADLRAAAAIGELPEVLFIDDADRFGNDASLLARDLARSKNFPLVILAVRSGRVERIADRLTFLKVPHQEVVIPRLTDNDIRAVLKVLSDARRLGVLKNMPPHAQVEAFRNRERANRDLLVAMLEATSGRRFAERLEEELEQLAGQQRFVYAMASIATAYRIGLTKNQVLLGVGDASNETLQAIEDLTRRLLLVEHPRGDLKVRHRVVGERVVRYLTSSGGLRDPLQSLTIALATELGPLRKKNSASYRAVRVLMNHDWLQRTLGNEPARGFMAEIEPYMAWDHHYWLQRGTLELESGDESLAENFLNQAAGMEPDDHLVHTEVGYLRVKFALREPDFNQASAMLLSGLALLANVIARPDHFDPHQYDIYGRHVLKWTQRSELSFEERAEMLRNAAEVVEAGRRKHPRDDRLRELYVSIQNRRLGHT